jgi:RNA ligase (TIGR02306 family)
MTERKLATVRTIAEVKPIKGADKICAYRVDGWWVVDQVGKYKVGDRVIYCEVDSFIPHHLAPFLSKGKEPREFDGTWGERLRTIKLKGQLSQGLLLPLTTLTDVAGHGVVPADDILIDIGTDVADWLGILKYEKPVPVQLAGLIRGNFPSEIPKTDQERVQNLTKEFAELQQYRWAVTEKLDGCSATYFLDNTGDFHVCSRNLDLKPDENNLYWKIAIQSDIENKMRNLGLLGHALQGEIIGEGIQGNQYKCKPCFNLFDVYKVGEGYLPLGAVHSLADMLGVKAVPLLDTEFSLTQYTVEELLTYANGKSKLNGSQREGVVFQCLVQPEKSFKVISDEWLLKNE